MLRSLRLAAFALALPLLFHGSAARATLGEPEESVGRDRDALAMARQPPTARGSLGVHELRSATVTVREYVAPSGRIFAVAWSGLTRPDLGPLLGSFFDEYREGWARPPTARGPRRVETARLVVETWGHARSLHGRAWLPELVPAGTNLDDVQ